MTPEQKFSRWVQCIIIAFLFMFGWFIYADIWIPITPQATVMRSVTPVSSRVSGYISKVYIKNNEQVKKGDVIYELDPALFINKVNEAKNSIEQAKLSNLQLDAQILEQQANLKSAEIIASNNYAAFKRYQHLVQSQGVSQEYFDKVQTTWQSSEQNIKRLQSTIQNLKIQRGERSENRNITVQKYLNLLERNNLNLDWTKVRAATDGTVSNLQLNPGLYTTAGVAVLALISDSNDIVADFREKSLRHARPDTRASVVFDALPGKVFRAHIASRDAGTLHGQEAVNGQLSQPESSTRWVRDAQRMRIHLILDEPMKIYLPTGARATVQLYNSSGKLASIFGGVQIYLTSILHYVY